MAIPPVADRMRGVKEFADITLGFHLVVYHISCIFEALFDFRGPVTFKDAENSLSALVVGFVKAMPPSLAPVGLISFSAHHQEVVDQ